MDRTLTPAAVAGNECITARTADVGKPNFNHSKANSANQWVSQNGPRWSAAARAMRPRAVPLATAKPTGNLPGHAIWTFAGGSPFSSQGRFALFGRISSLSKPNLDHFGSDEFCFESYIKNK